MITWFVFALGLLFGWAARWWWGEYRQQPAAVEPPSTLQAELEALRENNRALRAQITQFQTNALIIGEKDRLQDIKGIGSVFAGRLHEAGVHTFSDLAAQTPEQVRQIIKPQPWQAVDLESWIVQAQQFAAARAAVVHGIRSYTA